MLPYLSPLPISVLSSLDTEAYKFYDRSNRLYDAAIHVFNFNKVLLFWFFGGFRCGGWLCFVILVRYKTRK